MANESDLYFERGGPVYRLMQRIGLIRGEDPSVRRRIIWFLAITWVPLLLLCLLEGRALGPAVKQPLLLDFAAYARFFIAVPLLFIAEIVIGPRLTRAGLHFIHAGFVRPVDYPSFERVIARVARWRESIWVELVMVAMALVGAWTFTAETVQGGALDTWQSTVSGEGGAARLSLAGLWYHIVAVPILQFFWYRWLWRLVIWTRFLFSVSRLDLDLVPTHADGAGGLGFLGTAQLAFSIIAFAVGTVLCAAAASLIVFEKVEIGTFKVPFIAMLVATEVLFLGPLLVFCPVMARCRRAALREYSLLVVRYNRAFHDKWIGGRAPEGEPLLGSADIQSMADLGNTFEFIRRMSVVPVNRRVILQLAVVVALPALPLFLLVMPFEQILDMLSNALL